MEKNNKKFEECKPEAGKDKKSRVRKDLPQYGKKGFDPRHTAPRNTVNLDDIVSNLIRYWNKTEGFDNVTKFPWNAIYGSHVDMANVITKPKGTAFEWNALAPQNKNLYAVPGVMKLSMVTGPGWAENPNDGVNRALAQLMARIRASLSTSNIGFETADLGMLLCSLASIACVIGHAKKILEMTRVWDSRNFYYPRALVAAAGYDWDDLISNMNKYVSQLNSYIDMYNNINILDMFDIFDRQYALSHNVYCDEDSSYGQLYFFSPVGYYSYQDTESKAHYTYLYEHAHQHITFDRLLGDIRNGLNSWYGSSDLTQINGTLLRAFKDGPVQKIPYVDLSTPIDPACDREILLQIMNSSVIQDVNLASLDITQVPEFQNFIVWKPYVSGVTFKAVSYQGKAQMLRIFEDDPTQEDNMEMTRLLNFASSDDYLRNCGSEIITGISIYRYDTTATYNSDPDDTPLKGVLAFDIGNQVIDISSATTPSPIDFLGAIQAFRYIPFYWIANLSGDDIISYGPVGDMYNYMLLFKDDWVQLNYQAYISLWTPINIG